MGREIKRVALDFDYPIGKMIWKGYLNPYRGLKCGCCDGVGESPEYKELSDNWYGFDNPEATWCYKITQDEVQALIDEGRLWDFIRVPITDDQRNVVDQKIKDGGNSWLPYNNGYVPTADEINKWAQGSTMGHDAINKWVCVKARAKRLGITETTCSCCNGEGEVWPDDKYKDLYENWENIEPPEGIGYQLWETTSEGTPMSPVFKDPKDLAQWLVDTEASTFGRDTATYGQWLTFIEREGYAPSAIMTDGVIESGVVALIKK